MKRLKTMGRMMILSLFVLGGVLFAQNAQAQNSFTMGELPQLNSKNGLTTAVFVESDEAVLLLKQEVEILLNEASDLNGGSTEAVNNLTTVFFSNIMDRVSTGETVYDSIQGSYPLLIAHASRVNAPVNVDAIVDAALAVLVI